MNPDDLMQNIPQQNEPMNIQQQNIPQQNEPMNDPESIQKEVSDDDILVHMNKKEVEELSALQPSGLTANNPWKIPEFHELNELIQTNPEVKEMLAGLFKNYAFSDKDEKKELQSVSEEMLPQENLEQFSPPQETPEAEMLGEMGHGGDTEIVLLPKELFEFFWDNVPPKYRNVNEETGFPEFSFWSGLLGIVGGLVGSFIAPGIGTAIGSAIGSKGGSLFDSPKQSRGNSKYIPSDPNNLEYDEGDEDVANELNSQDNGGGFFDAIGSALPYLGSLIPGMGGSGRGSGGIPGLEGIGKSNIPGLGGILSNPLEMIGKLFGQQENKNTGKKVMHSTLRERENLRKMFERMTKADLAKYLTQLNHFRNYNMSHHPILNRTSEGYSQYDPTKDTLGVLKDFLNPKVNSVNLLQNFEDQIAQPHKTGGEVVRHLKSLPGTKLIDGEESGQADNVYVDVPVHSYILDAATVSQIGDGSTKNGAKRMMEYLKKFPKIELDDKTMVKCALSAGEMKIDANVVNGIGDGDIKKGIKTLDQFVKKLRSQKGMNVNAIPEPTKNLSYYFKKGRIN